MTASELRDRVRAAWRDVPPPATDEMKGMEWGWGEAAARAFVGVAPVDVDTESAGFHAATPLFDLPPSAAAAYLGTFLISLLSSIELQESIGLFDDLVTRPHTITCLTSESFWARVIRRCLAPTRQHVVEEVVRFLAAKKDVLALTAEQVAAMARLAAPPASE